MQRNAQYKAVNGNPEKLELNEQPQTRLRAREDRSLGELLGRLSREAMSLVRDEVHFAKEEMAQKATRTGKDIASIAFGGAVALAGFLCLLAAAIVGLALFIPLWLSALSIGIVVSFIGAILLWRGFKRLEERSLTPRETVDTLKEEKRWMKDQLT